MVHSRNQKALTKAKKKNLFSVCLFPWSSKWSSWTLWGWSHCSYTGCLREGFSESWCCCMKRRLYGCSLSSKGNTWMWVDWHGLWCHNLMTRIVGRDGVSRRWNRYRDVEEQGVSCVHLLHCSVATVWLWTLPLARVGWGSDCTEGFLRLFMSLFALGVHPPDWNCLHTTACKALHQSWVLAPEILQNF